MKILEELEKMGIELTDEQKTSVTKKFTEEVISTAEAEKKVSKVQAELETANDKLKTTEDALKAFDGVDAEGLKTKIKELEEANKQKDEAYKKELETRDYKDAIEKLASEIKFSSNAAKKSFMADLEANPLQLRDGKILGFEDYLKNAKENDPDAFVKESDDNKAKFTTPNGAQTDDNKPASTEEVALRAAMGLEPVKK